MCKFLKTANFEWVKLGSYRTGNFRCSRTNFNLRLGIPKSLSFPGLGQDTVWLQGDKTGKEQNRILCFSPISLNLPNSTNFFPTTVFTLYGTLYTLVESHNSKNHHKILENITYMCTIFEQQTFVQILKTVNFEWVKFGTYYKTWNGTEQNILLISGVFKKFQFKVSFSAI